MRFKSTAVSVGVLVAIIFVAGMSGAVAGSMITGAQIKNGTVTGTDVKNSSLTGVDVKNGSITGLDIAAATKNALRGARGATGASGISHWMLVKVSSPPQPANTLDPTVSAACPTGTKLLSASARWHIWNQSELSLSYNDDGSGANAMANDGSPYNSDYIDLKLICATVAS